jgi:hypothetical protein
MNNQEKQIEDNLMKYFSPEMNEKAPEGFTSKVMTRIQMSPAPSKPDRVELNRSLVPYISAAVTLALITAAFILQGNTTNSEAPSVLVNLFKNINLSFPQVDLSSFSRIKFPEIMSYIFIGLFILVLFDRGLYRLFHRGKEERQ